ncbi:MAG: hypothetical protein J6I84_02480 [Bacilli bacterium]|nr:hypothetical protein [Bacilli bacterium]
MSERLERIEKLKQVAETVKTEYVGLDGIIDELEKAICPWYITPEIIERPQIISLWGMTGTGKTSVVKRFLELLGLIPKTLFLDCGELAGDSGRSLTDKINDYLGEDEDAMSPEGLVFVFDEFQYSRTLNESGEEVTKSNLRPVWSLIDSGIINLTENSWDAGTFESFYEDLRSFADLHPGIVLDECNIINPDDVKTILGDLGLVYFGRGIPGFMKPKKSYSHNSDEDAKEDEDPYRPLRVIEDNIVRILRWKLKQRCGIEYFQSVLGRLMSAKTLIEFVDVLGEQRQYVLAPRNIDCSGSLVFILGNLDEAYRSSEDINPDLDADMFYDTTSKVTISDIKEALKKRFRPEQIARFGNNIIRYPSLSRAHFIELIEKECDRVCRRFTESTGISVRVAEDLKNLLYSEGVYPVQGARPIFTTISTILTPLFSRILIFLDSKENKESYNVILSLNGQTDFKRQEIKAYIEYSDVMRETVTVPLQLGAERDPACRKTRVPNSVHESGHAIVMAYLTGIIPTQVISVSTDHGGFCLTYDKDKHSEIPSRGDIANNVCIGLAGYEAEKLIFGERSEKLLCGSTSDIETTWNEFAQEAYRGGYFEPFSYSSYQTENTTDGIPSGYGDDWLRDKIKSEFDRLRNNTVNILTENKKLLCTMAKKMSESGGLSAPEIKDLIDKNYEGTLTSERLAEAAEDNSYSWYLKKLEEQV